ncbi:hypothetical protein ACFX13_028629 [Malus domestica]
MGGLSLSKFRWWPSKGTHLGSSNTNDTSLLMLTLTCNAAITKLGQAKISCPQFFVRFLIGGSILYYPQLSSISSY